MLVPSFGICRGAGVAKATFATLKVANVAFATPSFRRCPAHLKYVKDPFLASSAVKEAFPYLRKG
ncbi:hypothetical protein B1H26_09735 [Amycolatopsis sp. BJA-103]|nr:hypothetical protein BKN51_22750 [Amycolatopsis sp. BJA-103]PNE21989.1 hypothetical protein B1H26_09735 [Amycolatopsis sp. BJA-103]